MGGKPKRNAKSASKAKALIGRPPKLIADDATIDQVHDIASLQCTKEEAAAILKVGHSTFKEFLANNKKAADAWELGAHDGKASLRRLQYISAKEGSATMQIWLGKQWLGQRDKSEIEHAGKVQTEDVTAAALKGLDAEQRDALRSALESVAQRARAGTKGT